MIDTLVLVRNNGIFFSELQRNLGKHASGKKKNSVQWQSQEAADAGQKAAATRSTSLAW